jgi:anti-sigma factor (TIGR02949 family)
MSNETDKHEVEDIDCIEAVNLLYAYMDGEIDDKETKAKYEHHLAHCRSCYSRMELEKALTERIKKSAKANAPEHLQNRLRKLIDGF